MMNNETRLIKFQLDYVLKGLISVLFASTFVAGVMAFLLNAYVDATYLAVWFSLIFFANLCRYIVKRDYLLDPKPDFQNIFAIIVFLQFSQLLLGGQ